MTSSSDIASRLESIRQRLVAKGHDRARVTVQTTATYVGTEYTVAVWPGLSAPLEYSPEPFPTIEAALAFADEAEGRIPAKRVAPATPEGGREEGK